MGMFKKKSPPSPFIEGGDNLFFMETPWRSDPGEYCHFYEEGNPSWHESIRKCPRILIDDDIIKTFIWKKIHFGCGVGLHTMKPRSDLDVWYWIASYGDSNIKLNLVEVSPCPIKLFYPNYMSNFRAIIEDPCTNSKIFRDLIEEKDPGKLSSCEKVLASYLKR